MYSCYLSWCSRSDTFNMQGNFSTQQPFFFIKNVAPLELEWHHLFALLLTFGPSGAVECTSIAI